MLTIAKVFTIDPKRVKDGNNIKPVNYKIFHTIHKISSDEKPSSALRKGVKSSMRLAVNSVKNGESEAVVSAGNTGALMAMSKIVLRPLESGDIF